MKKKLTEKEVHDLKLYMLEHWHHDENNGVFIWKKAPKYRSQLLGKNVGTLSAKGYINTIVANLGRFKIHRLIWLFKYGEYLDDSIQIDHIDGNKSNNILSNLRKVTNQENQKNLRMKINNTSGKMGVYLCQRHNAWKVIVTINGKQSQIYFSFGEKTQKRLNLSFSDCKNYQYQQACRHCDDLYSKSDYHENHGKVK